MMSQGRTFNKIYDELVSEPYDTVGLVAYGIYKRSKIEYVKKFTEENGKEPSGDDLKPFHDISKIHIEHYRDRAYELMEQFLEKALSNVASEIDESNEKLKSELLIDFENRKKQLEEDYLTRRNQLEEKFHLEVQDLKPNRLVGVLIGSLESLIGSFLFFVFLGVLVIMFTGIQVNFLEEILRFFEDIKN